MEICAGEGIFSPGGHTIPPFPLHLTGLCLQKLPCATLESSDADPYLMQVRALKGLGSGWSNAQRSAPSIWVQTENSAFKKEFCFCPPSLLSWNWWKPSSCKQQWHLPSVPKKCHISPQSELNQQRLLGIAATNLRPSKTQTFYQLRHISASPGPAAVAQPREPLGVAVMPCNKQVFGDPSLSLTAEILLTAPRVNPDPF